MDATRPRDLRLAQTEVEKRLWYRIRNRQLGNCKFRRQVRIGSYIVDFICYERRLIVELDGGQHALTEKADGRRDSWLRSQGFSILRFWNNEVIDNMDGVLQRIDEELARLVPVSTPHPIPLPQGEREH